MSIEAVRPKEPKLHQLAGAILFHDVGNGAMATHGANTQWTIKTHSRPASPWPKAIVLGGERVEESTNRRGFDGELSLMNIDYLHAITLKTPNRDRGKPHGFPLPHHRTYGSRIRRFDELNSYRGARLGSPNVSNKRNGSALANAGVFDNRHGPWADLLVFHASRTDTPRLRSSR